MVVVAAFRWAAHWSVLFVLASSGGLGACTSGKSGGSDAAAGMGGGGATGGGGSGAGATGGGGSGGGAGNAGMAGSAGSAGGSAGSGGAGGGSAGQNGGAGGAGVEPTVVATFDNVPMSLALDGANLYVTILETGAGKDGKVQTVAKTALGATTAGAAITTLASGLVQPGTITVYGTSVFWAGLVGGFTTTLSVPTAGGQVIDVTGVAAGAVTYSRIAIANSVLYASTGHNQSISAFPLTGGAGGAAQVIFEGGILEAIDTDGSSVFFVAKIPPSDAAPLDLLRIPVGGGAVTNLAMKALALANQVGDCDLIHDATTLYWGDTVTGGVYSLPKTGGAPKLLATLPINGNCPEFAVDSNDVYVLEPHSLSRFPKSGGTPVTLAVPPKSYLLSTSDSPIALALDDTYVYWLNKPMGQILKLAK
jgi:hypothetical protein